VSNNQFAFTPGYKGADASLVLLEALREQVKEKGAKAWVMFIDMTAAYHTVNRHSLYHKLYEMT
jgi:hypothetical protein